MNWMDRLGTGVGDFLIGANQPFGLAPPQTQDRQAAIQQGALSLGMNMLANPYDRPTEALGKGYQMAQQQGMANQRHTLAMEQMMAQAEENRTKREEQRRQQEMFERYIAPLSPEQQLLARQNPDAFTSAQIKSQFAPPDGAPEVYGTVHFDANGNPWVLDRNGNMRKPGGLEEDVRLLDPYSRSFAQSSGTMAGKAPDVAVDEYIKKIRPDMERTQSSIAVLDQAESLLSKSQTGALADNINTLRSLGATLGFNVDEETLSNTQAYQNFMANVVIPRLQDFGGNDSNEEMRYLKATMGGDINQSKEALQATISLTRKLLQKKLQGHRAIEEFVRPYLPNLPPVSGGSPQSSQGGPLDDPLGIRGGN